MLTGRLLTLERAINEVNSEEVVGELADTQLEYNMEHAHQEAKLQSI